IRGRPSLKRCRDEVGDAQSTILLCSADDGRQELGQSMAISIEVDRQHSLSLQCQQCCKVCRQERPEGRTDVGVGRNNHSSCPPRGAGTQWPLATSGPAVSVSSRARTSAQSGNGHSNVSSGTCCI